MFRAQSNALAPHTACDMSASKSADQQRQIVAEKDSLKALRRGSHSSNQVMHHPRGKPSEIEPSAHIALGPGSRNWV